MSCYYAQLVIGCKITKDDLITTKDNKFKKGFLSLVKDKKGVDIEEKDIEELLENYDGHFNEILFCPHNNSDEYAINFDDLIIGVIISEVDMYGPREILIPDIENAKKDLLIIIQKLGIKLTEDIKLHLIMR